MACARVLRQIVIGLCGAGLLCSCTMRSTETPQTEGALHLSRGVAYERSGEWDLALHEYELASQSDGRGNFYLGNLLFQQNKLDAAEHEYRKAMTVLRADPALYNNLAWLLYTRRQKLEEAEELASLAVKIAGEAHFAEYWDTLEQIRQLRDQRKAEKAARLSGANSRAIAPESASATISASENSAPANVQGQNVQGQNVQGKTNSQAPAQSSTQTVSAKSKKTAVKKPAVSSESRSAARSQGAHKGPKNAASARDVR